jgi:hypothetical protein
MRIHVPQCPQDKLLLAWTLYHFKLSQHLLSVSIGARRRATTRAALPYADLLCISRRLRIADRGQERP